MTLCIYGVPYTGTEGHLLLETAKNDVPLEKLQNLSEIEIFSPTESKINLTTDDIELLNNYTIESLISPYIKCEVMGGLKRAYYVNPPNVNMVEKTKTGYIYYENDLNYYSQCLYNFYLSVNTSNIVNKDIKENNIGINIEQNILVKKTPPLDEVTYQTYFKKTIEIVKILIAKNFTYLEEDCIFREENNEIFHKIPEYLVDIVINSLQGKVFGFSEVKYGLKTLKIMCNSSFHVSRFIDKGGLEVLYGLILTKEGGSSGAAMNVNSGLNTSNSSSTFSPNNFMVIKVMTLDIIYRLITHSKAFNKFMETIDKNKLTQQYFMIKEYTKDNNEDIIINEKDKEAIRDKDERRDRDKDERRNKDKDKTSSKKNKKASDKDKDRDRDTRDRDDRRDRDSTKDKDRDTTRDKKRSKKDKKSKKDKREKSSSRSKSNPRSRSRSLSNNSDFSQPRRQLNLKDKKQAKNVLLKNGYQIILTLIIGKRNNLIINMVKKIVNKISFLMYLKELGNSVNSITTTSNTNNSTTFAYTDKISDFLQKIFEYLQKIEIAYKKAFDKDQPCGLSDEYPYRNFWIDYLKIGRKFFKKSDTFNLKSTLENENNSTNKITENKIITNEIAIMLEESNFLENLILLLSDEKFISMKNYTENVLLIKNILSLILLSKGGINLLSKNFEVTMALRNFLNKATDGLMSSNNPMLYQIIREENFFSLKVNSTQTQSEIVGHCGKGVNSLYENPVQSNINNVLININEKSELSEDFVIKINLLQLRYFLELQFVVSN
jgi:hypothetical protein